MIKLIETGICENVQKSLAKLYSEHLCSNPFVEKWGKGRPTLEKQIRRDLYQIWNFEHNPMLQALRTTRMDCQHIPVMNGKKREIRIKFIKRG